MDREGREGRKDIKLIALDLDGTTLNSFDRISENTGNTLSEAVRSGVHVVVATGRPMCALPEDVKKIDGIEYAITSNGACLTRLADDKLLHHSVHDPKAIETIAAMLRPTNYMTEIFVGGKAYIGEQFFYDPNSHKFGKKRAEYISATRIPVPDIYDYMLANKDAIENINVNFYDQESKMKFWKEADALGIATVTSSYFSNVELGGLKASKANALEKLCEILDVDRAHTMACGDSPNDLAMLHAAGFSVAMGNAVDSVKEAADYVTLTNDEDGVAAAVRKFVLGA